MSNPFFIKRNFLYNAIPFDQIKLEHFMPAIEKGLSTAYKKIEHFKQCKEPATFDNTILAIENFNEDLEEPLSVYYTLLSCESDNDFKELAEKISPMISQLRNSIMTDNEIFTRVKSIYHNLPNLKLLPEQKRLVELVYLSFVRNGALLDEKKKKQLLKIDQELSVLSPLFSKNVLNATNAYSFHITKKKELEGLPKNHIMSAAVRAKEKGYKTGWLFNLQAPSMIPALTYLKNRELRKKIYLASVQRCFQDQFDNQEIVLKEVNLRYQRAKLLGYKTHAHYVLEQRMAENPETVVNFLDRIYQIAMPLAKKETQVLKKYAKKIDNLDDLMPWDVSYYSEKFKQATFGYDAEELRAYFKVENCIQGIFSVAEKLYHLKFVAKKDYAVWHQDVKVYEVTENNGDFVGLLYIDLFPRETKSGGAWMNCLKTQGLYDGKLERPHVIIVGNMTPSTSTSPSLLSLNEVNTLFHEFGHALHGLLSNCTYQKLASPNVYWDFVELPSQIMENWLLEEETLALFAKHYQTSEFIPKSLLEKVKAAENYNKATANIRQLNFALLDMAWHNTNPSRIKSITQYEEKTLKKLRLLPKIENALVSPIFSHIFSGGYSAGYYSYKWAEVLDADAFEKFKKEGIFNTKTAKSFRDNILSKGNTEHPMKLYQKFRGRKPDPDAMLRRDGLLAVIKK